MPLLSDFGGIFAVMTKAIISNRAHRWAVAGFFFMAGICFASWASRIPDIKQHLQLNDAALGAVLFALPVGLMCSLPLSGWSVAKWGSRQIMTIAAIGYPLTLLTLGSVDRTWELVVALFTFGLFGNLFNISINTQAVGVESLYGRSIMASFHGTWSLAGFTGATIGTFVVSKNISPFIHFIVIAGITLSLLLIARRYALAKDVNKADKGQPIFVKPDARLLKLGLIGFGCMVCEGTMFDWSGVYFQKVVAVPQELTTLGYAAFMSTMAGGRFFGDWLTTRLGVQRMLQCSGVVITTGLLTAILFPFLVPATIGFLLVGVGVSSVVPLVYSAAGKSKTMSPGMALAAVSTVGFFGFLFGPPMIGFVAQVSSLRWSFALISCFGLATAVLATVTRWD